MGSVGRKFGDSGSWTGRLVFIVRVLIDCWEPGHFLFAAHLIKKKKGKHRAEHPPDGRKWTKFIFNEKLRPFLGEVAVL